VFPFLKALTFKIRFSTAQFKDHTSKLTRRTYLIPPPSVVAGVFGAVLGLKRKELFEMSREILAGAELKSLNGRIVTLARIFKFDRTASQLLTLVRSYYEDRNKVIKDIQGILPIKESEELYMPEYKFAVASSNESLIDEGIRRLRDFSFEYEIFGGNDYHFIEFIGEPKTAKMNGSREGCGYCPREDFERIESESFNIAFDISAIEETRNLIVMPVMFLANVNKEFVQVYGAKIVTKRELDVVDDGESKIFVYEVSRFLVMQI
jgi:CRISPR-associated Cas5-like protein